jgi:Ca-activated chloride channel family protein
MTRGTRRARSLLLVALLLGGSAGAESPEVRVAITSPPAGEFAYGPVEFTAEVEAPEPPARVVLEVDGRTVRVFDRPPYSVKVDLGEENVEHRFRATAQLPGGATSQATLVTPVIQIDEQVSVDLQQLFVTVTDGPRRVLDLVRGDFRVLEDGQPQRLVTFERGDVPLTAVILLDSSESMLGGRLEAAVRGAHLFAAGMRALDEAMLLLFSDRVLRTTDFSASADQLLAGLQGVQAAGGTAVNDHLYLALKLLDGQQGRRVVILFSDGADVVSALRMSDVIWKARRSQAIVYWIRLADSKGRHTSFTSAWRDNLANTREAEQLEAAVDGSGGRVETIPSVDDIEDAFRGILAELREQYVLGYYPSHQRHDGGWRQVEVKVPGRLAVRTRDGYVDY